MSVTLDDLRRIAEVEFNDLIVDVESLEEKIRLFLDLATLTCGFLAKFLIVFGITGSADTSIRHFIVTTISLIPLGARLRLTHATFTMVHKRKLKRPLLARIFLMASGTFFVLSRIRSPLLQMIFKSTPIL